MNAAPTGSVAIEAPAKINLYLHVVGRRSNGYHELESLIAFTDEFDVLTLEASDELTLEIDGAFAGRLPTSDGLGCILQLHTRGWRLVLIGSGKVLERFWRVGAQNFVGWFWLG